MWTETPGPDLSTDTPLSVPSAETIPTRLSAAANAAHRMVLLSTWFSSSQGEVLDLILDAKHNVIAIKVYELCISIERSADLHEVLSTLRVDKDRGRLSAHDHSSEPVSKLRSGRINRNGLSAVRI